MALVLLLFSDVASTSSQSSCALFTLVYFWLEGVACWLEINCGCSVDVACWLTVSSRWLAKGGCWLVGDGRWLISDSPWVIVNGPWVVGCFRLIVGSRWWEIGCCILEPRDGWFEVVSRCWWLDEDDGLLVLIALAYEPRLVNTSLANIVAARVYFLVWLGFDDTPLEFVFIASSLASVVIFFTAKEIDFLLTV